MAALTPEGHEVEILDESVEGIDFNRTPDLVGLTGMTAVAPRAYEIARRFRDRGSTVVMGGIHATACPREVRHHVDSVVLGEAEGLWPRLVSDLEAGELQPYYFHRERPEAARIPQPRRDLYRSSSYLTVNTMQVTRGCPYRCSFCAVSQFFGQSYRFRPLENVLEEIDSLKGRLMVFVDDNIIGSPSYARRLFKEMRPLKKRWIGQASINIAEDEKLLDLARDSGCVALFIGFESLKEENIAGIGKAGINRVDGYQELISRIHDRGINIEGAFIFGFEHDDTGVFQRTVDFAIENGLAAAQFGILTPLPGTKLYRRLMRERRITDYNWANYSISRVVFEPHCMRSELLQDGFNWAWRKFYSWPSILKRLLQAPRQLSFFLSLNMSFRRGVLRLPRPRLIPI